MSKLAIILVSVIWASLLFFSWGGAEKTGIEIESPAVVDGSTPSSTPS